VWTKPYFKVKILRLKCTKFDFGWGYPTEVAYSTPRDAPPRLKGPTSKGGEGREGEGNGEEGRGGKGQGMHPNIGGDRRPWVRVEWPSFSL